MGIFAADELGEGTFGRGSTHGLFLAHGVPSQSLAPFRFRRTIMASPSPQGYCPPVFWAFLRRTNLGKGPSGAYFWARQCPQPIFGTRRPLAKSDPIPSPADEFGQRFPPRLWPTRFLGIFAADELGDGTFGCLFLGAAVPTAYFWHTEAPRKVWPHSESGGRTWPAPPPKAIAHSFFGHFYGG